MHFSSISQRVIGRLRRMAHWRCQEPVLIFESDDWGLARHASAHLLRSFGEPGEWADEELETPQELAGLYRVLERYIDPTGRPACFVSNFVVANPDFEAIEQDHYSAYHDLPINQTSPASLQTAWRDGCQRRVFYPQYHARAHLWSERWLHDLRTNAPGARRLFEARCYGGLSLLRGEGWRYHSEYLNWDSGAEWASPNLDSWLASGLNLFRTFFGGGSRSTIPPHYLFTPRTCQAWHKAGIQYIQGSNYRTLRPHRPQTGERIAISHALGEHSPEGLTYMARNVKFDPRPQRPANGVKAALRQIEAAFRSHIPAIIDTHRINYTGAWGQQGIAALDDLLTAVASYRPRILTTVELGEAIHGAGAYRDIWSGQAQQLSALDTPFRRALRLGLQRYNHRLSSRA
ncbi:MAG: hypothetical protein IT324_22415 [Anaerolineae bacterium]|nr:hypothetical protein [Anaerolineae bacterium]